MNDKELLEIVARGIWTQHELRGEKWETELDIIKVECWEQAADALATRVPVQGEPNGDQIEAAREVLGVAWFEPGGMDQPPSAETVRAALVAGDVASRATVPDAATELAQAKSDMKTMAEVSRGTFDKIRAERDASPEALAKSDAAFRALKLSTAKADSDRIEMQRALERVRALHFAVDGFHCEKVCAHRYCIDDSGDQHKWPCPTLMALDGAPSERDIAGEIEAEVESEGGSPNDFHAEYVDGLKRAAEIVRNGR